MAEDRTLDHEVSEAALRQLQAKIGGEVKGGKLYPLAPFMAQFDQPRVDTSFNRRTYLVQAAPQQESKVVDLLRESGLDAYCPKEPKSVRVNAVKRRTVDRPMMPGYVFPIFDLHRDRWQVIPKLRGVVRLFMVVEWPVPIPQAAIDSIKDHEIRANMRGKGRNWRAMPFKVNSWVQIDDFGPWHGFIGQVTEALATRERIRIGIDVFGRQTPVEVSVNQVRAV